MSTYNILTFDGGGVKGIFSLQILIRLLEDHPDLVENTHLVAGNSTGSIISLALASGLAPLEIMDLYKKYLPKVFKDSYWDNIVDLGNLIGAQYDYSNLKNVLKTFFGDKTLGDLQKKVLIPAVDLDNDSNDFRTWKPKFYNSFQEDDLNEQAVDVCLKSAVAPTFFPVYEGFTDGGLAANVPTVSAIAQAIDTDTGGQELNNLRVFAVGTGISATYISGRKLDWGISQWARSLIPIMFDCMVFTTDYQCKSLLGDKYHRIDTVYDRNIQLDDVNELEYLLEKANAVDLTETKSWLHQNWKQV